MQRIQNDDEPEEVQQDFSFYRYTRKSKQELSEKLGAVGALDVLINAGEDDTIVQPCNESDDDNEDLECNEDDDCSTIGEDNDEDLETYYLSLDDYRTYGTPRIWENPVRCTFCYRK